MRDTVCWRFRGAQHFWIVCLAHKAREHFLGPCSYVTLSSLLIVFVAFPWTHSSLSTSLLCWGAQHWSQHSRKVPPVLSRGEGSSPQFSDSAFPNATQHIVSLLLARARSSLLSCFTVCISNNIRQFRLFQSLLLLIQMKLKPTVIEYRESKYKLSL